MISTINLSNCSGYELINHMNENNKIKIVIKSVSYNDNGAYWPFESTYITKDSDLYKELTKNSSIKTSYVDYYNNVKHMKEKQIFNMPKDISVDQIASIYLYILPNNYIEYYNR